MLICTLVYTSQPLLWKASRIRSNSRAIQADPEVTLTLPNVLERILGPFPAGQSKLGDSDSADPTCPAFLGERPVTSKLEDLNRGILGIKREDRFPHPLPLLAEATQLVSFEPPALPLRLPQPPPAGQCPHRPARRQPHPRGQG